MKNIYTIITGIFLLFAINVIGQTRIYTPDLNAPENGETGIFPDVILDWDAVTGGSTDITYELQLDVTDDFSTAVTFPITNLTALKMSELLFSTTYYWHVRAFDGNNASDWSETWSFTTSSAVSLLKPIDGAFVYSNPFISWKPISGLTEYQLQIDTTYLWSNENLGSNENLNGTFILDTNKWIVGDNGFVTHFDGISWNTIDVGTNENLNAVFFVNANNGWIVGDNGTILHFDGSAWIPENVLNNKNLNDVSFYDDNTGWIVGDSGIIVVFNSGNFTIDTTEQGYNLYAVSAVSNNHVFIGGKKGYIYSVIDTTWETLQLNGKKDVYAFWFDDASHGWSVGKSGKIFYYDGNTWTKQPSGITKDLYGVSFSGNIGYAVGKSGYMLRYKNNTWETVASGSASTLNSIYLTSNDGIVVGNNGTILKSAGSGFTSPYSKIISVNKDSSEVQLSNLLFGKTFYYRIRATHAFDTSDWSTVKAMTTYAKPSLSSPSNNANNQALFLTFKWQNFNGVIRYTIQTSNNENFEPALTYFSDSNSIVIDNFNFNKTYYWRVNAINADDISQWSDVYSFNTANSVVLVSPANESDNVNKSPRFEWENIDGVNKYQIMIADNSDFNNPISKITEKAFYQSVSSLQYTTNYFWKVRGIVGLDTSDWSPVWQFVTESAQGIQNNLILKSVLLYPNPNRGNFKLTVKTIKNNTYTISIIDIQGKECFNKSFEFTAGETTKQFNLNLRKGIYTFIISDGINKNVNKLFIK